MRSALRRRTISHVPHPRLPTQPQLTFAEVAKPDYSCAVHGNDMTGEIVVQ